MPELEQLLEGVQADATQIEQHIADFFETHAVEAPGIQPSDLAQTLVAVSR